MFNKIIIIPGFGFSPKVMEPLGKHLSTLYGVPPENVEYVDLLKDLFEYSTGTLASRIMDNTLIVGFSLGGLVALSLVLSLPRSLPPIPAFPLKGGSSSNSTSPLEGDAFWITSPLEGDAFWITSPLEGEGRVGGQFHLKSDVSLLLISSTPSFLSTPDWPGISPDFFEKFERLFKDNPPKALKQFLLLQLPSLQKPTAFLKEGIEESPLWTYWLSVLKERDLRMPPPPTLPIHIILGEEDTLLPAKALSKALASLWPAAKVQVLKGKGHFFLENPSEIEWK